MDLLSLPRAVTASALALGTAVRGARVLHPRGQAWAGTMVTEGDSNWGARLLDEAGRHDVVVLGARGDGDGWELLAAPVTGGWTRWGRLTLGKALPDAESEELRFVPTLGAD